MRTRLTARLTFFYCCFFLKKLNQLVFHIYYEISSFCFFYDFQPGMTSGIDLLYSIVNLPYHLGGIIFYISWFSVEFTRDHVKTKFVIEPIIQIHVILELIEFILNERNQSEYVLYNKLTDWSNELVSHRCVKIVTSRIPRENLFLNR